MKNKRVMSYRKHVIWMNEDFFMVALDRNGTDRYYESIEEAMEAIDKLEDDRSYD